ncbi:MAG: GH23 [uncultured Cytophagales bacterium]|uniref:GH23 n=1 Tax=uncultured Cytophagales bacterium TaxID=158755 RepID=A0A6J4K172_9SPHI|nr:MAG: GH23 [uncultured Cytophagales bacterium]
MINLSNSSKTSIVVAFSLIVFLKQFSFSQTAAGDVSGTNDTIPQAAASATPSATPGTPSRPALIPQRMSARERSFPLRQTKSVKKVIGSLTTTGRTHIRKMLQRQPLYFPVFEEVLSRHGLPNELKYLPVIESSLNPRAVSPVKAAGLWQFMPSVGSAMGLQVDAYVDERMDAEKATIAASCYLKALHNMFGDWELALAAYNAGPGRVRRAIRRSGNQTSLSAISAFLPEETRNYVPTFVAVTHVMTNHASYNIYPDSLAPAASFDTIHVSQPLSLTQLAKNLDVSLKELQELNPAFKYNLIPAFVKQYTVRIPNRAMGTLAARREAILEAAAPKLLAAQKQVLLAGNITSAIRLEASQMEVFTDKKKVTYEVRGTEGLEDIAAKYGVEVATIQDWNYLNNQKLRVGQKLVLYLDRSGAVPAPGLTPETSLVALIEEIEGNPTMDLEDDADSLKPVDKLPGASDINAIVAANQ